MYRYDAIDKEIARRPGRSEFREQVARRLAGELTEDQFKPLRLMNGLYLQLHAYMLRIAIPYGTLNPAQLRKLAYIARDLRQGLRPLHHPHQPAAPLDQAEGRAGHPGALAEVGMHAIQTSRQLHPQHHRRPLRRRHGRGDRRSRASGPR